MTIARMYNLADHAPVTEQAIEEEALWAAARMHTEGMAFECPSCGVTLELRTETKR